MKLLFPNGEHSQVLLSSGVNRIGTAPDAQVVLTQDGLVPRATKTAPHAVIVPFTNYMGDPAFDRVETAVKEGRVLSAKGIGAAGAAAAVPAVAAPAASTTPKPKRKKKPANDGVAEAASDEADMFAQAGVAAE